MNWGRVIVLGLVAGGLVGCGKQVEGPSKPAASHSTQTVKTPAKQPVIWSAVKAERLAAFMEEFAASRNQSYAKVTGDSKTTWQGLDLSSYLRDKRQVTFGNQAKPVKWQGTRASKSQTTANVVAVYADDTAGILYLFEVTPDKQAQVWVSQEAPGDGELTVKQTQAADLTAGFEQIVAGERAHLKQAATQSESASQVASAPQASQASAPAKPAAGHAPVFDASFQHTWYAYPSYDSDLHTYHFAANAMGYDGHDSTPVYLIDERDQADMDYLNSGEGEPPSQEKIRWGAASKGHGSDSRNYINVRGWYQTAGAGSFYRVVNRTIDGQSQPVLETASGAGAWVDDNFYLTPELAAANKGVVYSDQVER